MTSVLLSRFARSPTTALAAYARLTLRPRGSLRAMDCLCCVKPQARMQGTSVTVELKTVKSAIVKENERIGDLFTNADYDGSVLQYTEDCRVMVPKLGLIIGREAIRNLLQHGRDELGYIDMTLHVDDIGPLGSSDMIYEIGRAVKNVKDGPTVYENYVALRKNVDGKHLVHTLIFNEAPKPE